MNERSIRIGTRGSELALWQAQYIASELAKLSIQSEIIIIKTKGDRIQLSFDKMEGKGFFTKEIEEALLNNKVDLAVHSYKDLETSQPKGLMIACVTKRADPSDVLLVRKEFIDPQLLFGIKSGAIVGTSSVRRVSQIKLFRPDIKTKVLRGNVPTRIAKLQQGDYDAIILANAGLQRIQPSLNNLHVQILDARTFVSAPAQGALALQIRANDHAILEAIKPLRSELTTQETIVERGVLGALDGGCQSPVGCYTEIKNDGIHVWTSYAKNVDLPIRRTYIIADDEQQAVDHTVLSLKKPSTKKVYLSRHLDDKSILKQLLVQNQIAFDAYPLIKLSSIPVVDIPTSDWVFFSSKNSVKFFFNLPQAPRNRKFAAIGPATAAALRKQNIQAAFIGDGADTSSVGKAFGNIAEGTSVLFPQTDISLRNIQKEMPSNVKIIDLITYETQANVDSPLPGADILVFSSPSNAKAYYQLGGNDTGKTVVAIGPTTAATLKALGCKAPVHTWKSNELAIADAIFGAL